MSIIYRLETLYLLRVKPKIKNEKSQIKSKFSLRKKNITSSPSMKCRGIVFKYSRAVIPPSVTV